ncbi:MAG: adenine phosphoribosyltransferase [Eubacterium sp.]
MHQLEKYIRSIPDFPEPGIIFRDITTVTQDPEGLQMAVSEMKAKIEDLDFDVIVGLEARGFMFGTPIAYDMKKAFVPVRKKGKLPWKTIGETYELEYGSAEIEIHTDAIKPGQKVVIVDDLIATGGTVAAAIRLVERLGGEVVGCVFLTELSGLKGREQLAGYRVDSVVVYEGK